MPHVVTDNCQKCRFTECVATCPVACFHADDDMLYIDPVVCIDCGACIPACPVQAIYSIYDMPADKETWIDLNAQRAAALPVITKTQAPLPGAEERKAELGFE